MDEDLDNLPLWVAALAVLTLMITHMIPLVFLATAAWVLGSAVSSSTWVSALLIILTVAVYDTLWNRTVDRLILRYGDPGEQE
jgi:uncharacterized membrane protein YkvI